MKKRLTLKSLLFCIIFTILLLFLKDNYKEVWSAVHNFTMVFRPFLLGFLIAYILNFPYKFFETKVFSKMGKKRKFLKKFKRPLSLICTYAIVVAIITVLISIIVPQITGNISSLADKMPTYLGIVVEKVNFGADWVNKTFNMDISVNNDLSDLTAKLLSTLSGKNIADMSRNLLETLIPMITNTTAGLYNFIMAVIISVYFLSSKEMLCRQLKRFTVAFFPIKWLPKIYEIVDITDTKCGRFIVGDILDSALIGVLTFILMAIFKLPYAVLIAVFVGLTNIIPFFGPFIGAIPSALILLLESPANMIKFIVIVIVLQQLDGNLFKPKIIGSQLGLSSFWVLFSVLVGGDLFGIAGFILATPIYAVFYTLVKKRANNAIEEKGKIAQEALDFEVLNYTKIAEEQRLIREQRENFQKEKLWKFIRHENNDELDENEQNDKNEK